MKTLETIEYVQIEFFILLIRVNILAQLTYRADRMSNKIFDRMSNICDFDRILKTECNLQHVTRNGRIKNLDDFQRDEADTYFWRAGLLNVKEKGMIIFYIMKRHLVMFLRREKVNVVQL